MDKIQQRLSKLTVDELRSELKACGQKPIPITKTTRSLVERRIAKYLLEQQGGGEDEKGGPSDSESHKDATDSVSGKAVKESNAVAITPSAVKSQADVDAVCNERNSQMKAAPVVTNYFAICIPSKNDTSCGGIDEVDSTGSPDEILICQDRKEALTIAKKNKGARFKVFKTQEEAKTFAESNQDLSTPKPPSEPVSNQPFVEKATSNFRSVRPQDLVLLRKAIVQSDGPRFREMVWGNPRYLLNAGDTPTVLQEGCRYNSMHIIAKENLADMCQLVLQTLENPDFILLMYPDDPEDTLISRRKYLVDLYLNSPDKGVGETPLHFASKLGHVEVTELLICHPQCDKTLKNKNGETANEIVCSWSKASGEELKQKTKAIEDLLNDHYYVPLFRSEDNCTQPVIGEPWSPDLPELQSSPMFDFRHTSESPLDPVMSLQAYAGPMSPSEAECFRRNLRTPPSMERKRVGSIKRADGEKGMERIARELASKMRVSWAEYWSFLDVIVDITSPKGLQKLEEYLTERYSMTNTDNEELPKQLSAVKPKHTPVIVKKDDSLMQNLLGEFDRLHIVSANVAVEAQGNTEDKSSDKNIFESQKETSAEREIDGIVTERRMMPDNFKETLNAEQGNTVNCFETNKNMDASSSVKHSGECELVERTVKQNQIGSSERTDVQYPSGDVLTEAKERGKLKSTCPNQPESRTDCESFAIGDIKHPDINARERNAESGIPLSQSEMSAKPKNLSDGNTGPDQDEVKERSCEINDNCDDATHETLGKTRDDDRLKTTGGQGENDTGGKNENTKRAETEKTSTLEVDGSKRRATSTDGHCIPIDAGSPQRTEKDDEILTTAVLENAPCTQTDIAIEPHVGNGDGRGEIFSTPKVIATAKVRRGTVDKIGFILGALPTKTDLHVWRALAEVKIPDHYPLIRWWKQLVSSVPGETRDRWPTPARCETHRVPHDRPFQTPSPCHFRGFNPICSGSPLGLRARHFSEPTHRSREAGSLQLRQASFDVVKSLGGLKAKLFQE